MSSDSTTNVVILFSVAMTAIVMIVLFAVGIVPLWLAAVVIVGDAAFTWTILQAGRNRT